VYDKIEEIQNLRCFAGYLRPFFGFEVDNNWQILLKTALIIFIPLILRGSGVIGIITWSNITLGRLTDRAFPVYQKEWILYKFKNPSLAKIHTGYSLLLDRDSV
jgi:hypothetical protein